MAEHNRTGAEGERLAQQWLEANGFTVLHRNWRHGRAEIDIVAREGRFLVVVEVKTRASGQWGEPELAVNRAKRKQLIRAADELVRLQAEDLEVRFDIISIVNSAEGQEIVHIPNAFYATL